MPLAMPGDVEHVDTAEATGGDGDRAEPSADLLHLDTLEGRQRVGPRAGEDAELHQFGSIATPRAGAPLPPTMRSGKHATWNPCDGRAARLTSRSICE